MGPTGSDVGRGTAAGYVNMQTQGAASRHLDASALLSVRQRQSAPPDAPTSTWSRAVAAGRRLAEQERRPPQRALAGQRRAGSRRSRSSRASAFAPSVALGLGTPTRVTVGAQIVRQDNVPDYGIPGAAWADDAAHADARSRRRAPSIRATSTAAPTSTTTRRRRTAYTARVEHDLNRRLTLRNQTRYNETHREAVDLGHHRRRLLQPGDEPRHRRAAGQRAREHDRLEPDEPDGTVRDRHAAPRRQRSASSSRSRSSSRRRSPASAPARRSDIFNPNPNEPVTRLRPGADRAPSSGGRRDDAWPSTRSTPSS